MGGKKTVDWHTFSTIPDVEIWWKPHNWTHCLRILIRPWFKCEGVSSGLRLECFLYCGVHRNHKLNIYLANFLDNWSSGFDSISSLWGKPKKIKYEKFGNVWGQSSDSECRRKNFHPQFSPKRSEVLYFLSDSVPHCPHDCKSLSRLKHQKSRISYTSNFTASLTQKTAMYLKVKCKLSINLSKYKELVFCVVFIGTINLTYILLIFSITGRAVLIRFPVCEENQKR